MNKNLFSFTLIGLLCLIFSSSGCKDKETLKNGTFAIEETDLTKEFGSAAETIFIPIKTTLSLSEWKAETDADWLYVSTQEEKENGAHPPGTGTLPFIHFNPPNAGVTAYSSYPGFTGFTPK